VGGRVQQSTSTKTYSTRTTTTAATTAITARQLRLCFIREASAAHPMSVFAAVFSFGHCPGWRAHFPETTILGR
jgi:hypothetical protein